MGFSATFLVTKDMHRCQEIANGTGTCIAIAGNYTIILRVEGRVGVLVSSRTSTAAL